MGHTFKNGQSMADIVALAAAATAATAGRRGPGLGRVTMTARTSRVSYWVRVEGEHSRWELPGESDSTGILTSAGHLVTDEVIRTYGRKHVERVIMADLPPLPEEAWRVQGGQQQ